MLTAQPFSSARLTMRQQSPDDAEALHGAYRDADVMRFWSSAPHRSLGETVAYLTPSDDDVAWRGWSVLRKEDGRLIGTLASTERRSGVHEIGYLVLRPFWRQGYGREGVVTLIDMLFAEGVRRVYADVDPDNASSNRLMTRLGFTCEGRLRAEWETHIGIRDSLIWGLLADEWPSS